MGVGKDRFRAIPLFADLDDAQVRAIAHMACPKDHAPGETVMREGDLAWEVVAIEAGSARVEREGEPIGDLGPGDVVGELGVFTRGRRTATIVATTSMNCLSFTEYDVRRLAHLAPQAVARMRNAGMLRGLRARAA